MLKASALNAAPDWKDRRIAALILKHPLCEGCLAVRAGLGATKFEEALTALRATCEISLERDRCRACGAVTTVLSIDRAA